jgi:hypothetical protein
MISIPSGAFNILNEVITDLFEKKIDIYYIPKRVDCPNCKSSSLGYGRSISEYVSGGPIPFTRGQPCPYCNGVGYKEERAVEEIPARIYWQRKDWVSFSAKMNLPEGTIQVVVKEIHLPKLQRADYIIPKELDINQYNGETYRLAGIARPQGFQQNYQRYYATFWSINND